MTNHGLLNDPRTHAEVAGIIPFVTRNPSGNWVQWLPVTETQSIPVETFACVSYSLLHCLETQEYFLTGKRIRYSARWLAKASGTTSLGNYLVTVAQTVQQIGIVREETWPTPANYTFTDYYAEPTDAERQILLAEGAEWLKTHKFQWEWLTTNLNDILQHITQCPLQIVLPGHAVQNFYTQQELIQYFDTYSPFFKNIQRSQLTDVFKPNLTIKNMIRFVNDNGTIWIVGDIGKVGFVDNPAMLKLQEIDSAPIENGSTAGIPSIGLFESGLTFHQ